jgi:hypothetical protein
MKRQHLFNLHPSTCNLQPIFGLDIAPSISTWSGARVEHQLLPGPGLSNQWITTDSAR